MSDICYYDFFPINLRPEEAKYALYFEGEAPAYRNGNPVLLGGQELVVDGAMSCLYEREVYGSTGVHNFRLRARVKGSVQVSLFHTDQEGARKSVANAYSRGGDALFKFVGNYLLAEKDADPHQDEHEIILDFQMHSNELAYGRWSFSIVPTFGWAELVAADWQIGALPRRQVAPAFVICTFNRISQLRNNLTILTDILEREASEYRIIVVDNARSFEPLPQQTSSRLSVIAQKNC